MFKSLIFFLQLEYLLGKLLEFGLVIIILQLGLQHIDRSLFDIDRWMGRVIEVRDNGLLIEALIDFVSEVKAAIGAPWPPTQMEKLLTVSGILE